MKEGPGFYLRDSRGVMVDVFFDDPGSVGNTMASIYLKEKNLGVLCMPGVVPRDFNEDMEIRQSFKKFVHAWMVLRGVLAD